MSLKISEDQVSFHRHAYPQNAEINVTPFVDVMLVLLVIFMIAAPLATVTVPVDLPHNNSAPSALPTQPVTITLQADGTLFVGASKTGGTNFLATLNTATHNNPDTRILLRGDQHVQYSQLMAVMNALSDGGYTKLGLVAEQSSKP